MESVDMTKKEVKKSSYIINGILLCASLYMFMAMLFSTFSGKGEVKYYKTAMEECEAKLEQLENNKPEDKHVPGKPKLSNPEAFNSFNTSGRYVDADKDACSLSFYNTTGIQLYFMDYDYGETKFETEEDIRKAVRSKIESLQNIDNSLVIYSYDTSYDYTSPYYYYSGELIYYGKNVAEYLTPDDLNRIAYYFENAYDIFGWENRDVKMWSAIGDEIVNGHVVKNTEISDLQENIRYYEGQISTLKSVALVCGILVVVSLAFSVLFIFNIYKNVKLSRRLIEAEIELKEARATKEILEADVDRFTDVDEELVNKYSEPND